MYTVLRLALSCFCKVLSPKSASPDTPSAAKVNRAMYSACQILAEERIQPRLFSPERHPTALLTRIVTQSHYRDFRMGMLRPATGCAWTRRYYRPSVASWPVAIMSAESPNLVDDYFSPVWANSRAARCCAAKTRV